MTRLAAGAGAAAGTLPGGLSPQVLVTADVAMTPDYPGAGGVYGAGDFVMLVRSRADGTSAATVFYRGQPMGTLNVVPLEVVTAIAEDMRAYVFKNNKDPEQAIRMARAFTLPTAPFTIPTTSGKGFNGTYNTEFTRVELAYKPDDDGRPTIAFAVFDLAENTLVYHGKRDLPQRL